MSDFSEALTCAERALTLARDLDKVRGPGDLRQVASGVQSELVCVIQKISDGLDALRTDATGDRPGKVRNDALDTSRAAAGRVLTPGSKRAAVLLALYQYGDLTDFEIQERLKMDPNTERPRRGELVDANLVTPVVINGMAVTREHRGRAWQAWQLTVAGEAAAEQLAQGAERASGSRPETVGPQQLF
jgi:hypothetical protein